MSDPTADDARVPGPDVLYVDALGYVWQPGLPEGNISMARTTARNLPSPDLREYRPVPENQPEDFARGFAAGYKAGLAIGGMK